MAPTARAERVAAPITKRQIKALPVVRYEDVRAELRTGDLVFCSGSYVFSGLIQKFTRSVWSHVGIVHVDRELERVFVLESETGIGVRIVPVSKYLRDYHGRRRPYRGQIVIARVAPALDDAQARRAISHGLDLLTKPYDSWEIVRIAIRILLRRTRRWQDRKFICSELVDECYRAANVRFRRADNYVSPDDIWRDDIVALRCRVL